MASSHAPFFGPAQAATTEAAQHAGASDERIHPSMIRSFVRRAGRVTTAQARALKELAPRFVVPYAHRLLDMQAAWGRRAPLILEIGFGMGDATACIAADMPHINFLGCEVHEPGVGSLLRRIGEQGLGNIRIIAHDAVEVVDHMLPPACLMGVHIFFPDPWHKKRHHKRRLVQAPLIHRLAGRLRPGGYIHCATDWQPYAQQMLEVLHAEPLLYNAGTLPGGYAQRPGYRPLTKFEHRGLKLGHGVWDLVFRAKNDAMQ